MQKKAIKVNLGLVDDVANSRKEISEATAEISNLIKEANAILKEAQNPKLSKNLRFSLKTIQDLINRADPILNKLGEAKTKALSVSTKSKKILGEATKELPMLEKFGFDKTQIKGLVSLENEETKFNNVINKELNKLISDFADLV